MTALMLVSTKALQQARVYLLASLLSCTASAQLDSAIQDAVTALELSDVILASGLTDIRSQFLSDPGPFFDTTGQPVLQNYTIPASPAFGLDELAPIDTVRFGFVGNTTAGTCPASSDAGSNLLDGCLCQDYPGNLAVEVQFKTTYGSGNSLPTPIAGKKVLFIAYGINNEIIRINSVDINSDNFDGRVATNTSDISYFACYNPENLGELAEGRIGAIKSSGSKLGSINDCLSRGQNSE